MLVMKFGGTSVTRTEGVTAICTLLNQEKNRCPIIVVSALSGVTDLLVRLANNQDKPYEQELIAEIKNKHYSWITNNIRENKTLSHQLQSQIDLYLTELVQLLNSNTFANQLKRHDSIVAIGEQMSSFLITMYLNKQGNNTIQVLATTCIITNNTFGGADFLENETKIAAKKVLMPLIESGYTPVVTGFIGATLEGETTILGRGGSDYSAAIIGYAIDADEIQIWTDVDGIFTADPRVIKDAHLIKQLSYQEAAELAMFGAKVLHPKTMQPAINANIPLKVLNTFNLESTGSLITRKADLSSKLVKAITWHNTVPLINISSPDMFLSKNFLLNVFSILNENDISVNLLSASEVSVSFTLDKNGNIDQALTKINQFAKAEYLEGYGTISLVGEKIMEAKSLMQEIFGLFEMHQIRVEMLSYSASNINLSMVISSHKIPEILPILHKKLIAE